jgi:hypothetical protein
MAKYCSPKIRNGIGSSLSLGDDIIGFTGKDRTARRL